MGIDDNKTVNTDALRSYKAQGLRRRDKFLITDLSSKLSCSGSLNIRFRFLTVARSNLFQIVAVGSRT